MKANFKFLASILLSSLLLLNYCGGGSSGGSPDIYAAGSCKNDSTYVAGYWKNGTWTELTNSYGAYESTVVAIVVK
ncbi:MAG TPA: hypothetical protein PK514_05570 [Spirochaetota bacterium]|mgnify:CR=1 FL=1|nr:hypothetical protein [Spirochaetota bacterium]